MSLVPRDHFSRYLDARLDLSFVRDWVKGCYPDRDRPSIDPVVFFKRSLVMVFEGIRSERQLLTLAADRLSVRWYLGYSLDEALPDASSFSRIRQRLGLDIFRRFFEQVVDLCQDFDVIGMGGNSQDAGWPRRVHDLDLPFPGHGNDQAAYVTLGHRRRVPAASPAPAPAWLVAPHC